MKLINRIISNNIWDNVHEIIWTNQRQQERWNDTPNIILNVYFNVKNNISETI